ncbi:hypothetical protein [Antrihabitans cavernicola]|uniref:Uncharacterized protein n=1 Tax=Antrihabitans cavernicola TaxID=2495913 RepID=A0A5A7S690_9NOCA|nr:hypothetical protein [Spelaeibacter cavernicola]KAA0021406.1 hypothetical protein FOY51_19395 [Spelaeibacter cavernicola]
MKTRALHTRILIGAAQNIEQLASRALDLLGASARPPQTDLVSDSADPSVAAVQKAQRAATASGDHDLADRLSVIELDLRRQQRTVDDSVLPTHRGRLAAHDELEDIRKRLLANTPRPLPTDRD